MARKAKPTKMGHGGKSTPKFPNCRAKFTKDAYPYVGGVPQDETNPYWEENLARENKRLIEGYDLAVDEIVQLFEEDIDEIIEEYLGIYTASKIDKKILSDECDIDNYSYGEIAKMSKETYLLKVIYCRLRDALEMMRNEYITDLIEEQDEEE